MPNKAKKKNIKQSCSSFLYIIFFIEFFKF